MHRFIALLILSCLFATGCSSARYVSRDQERGVIAIPSTATWPVDHREKAMELMQLILVKKVGLIDILVLD